MSGTIVSPEELAAISTPSPTKSWSPTPHHQVWEITKTMLNEYGYKVAGEILTIDKHGKRFFGNATLESTISEGVKLEVGCRNSHDKSTGQGFVAGTRVLVCSNLCFDGDIKVSQKHTPNGFTAFEDHIADEVGRLSRFQTVAKANIERLKNRRLTEAHSDHLIMKAFREKIISKREIPSLLKEYEAPRHEEFTSPTAWSLLNAFTEIVKPRQLNNPTRAAQQTAAFHKLMLAT